MAGLDIVPGQSHAQTQSLASNSNSDGRALVTCLLDVRGYREMPKNFDLKVSDIKAQCHAVLGNF